MSYIPLATSTDASVDIAYISYQLDCIYWLLFLVAMFLLSCMVSKLFRRIFSQLRGGKRG